MHLSVIIKELVDSSARILLGFMPLSGVERQCTVETCQSNLVSIFRPVDVYMVVHGVLIDRVDAILYYFLDDLHVLHVEDKSDSSVE